jgi:hypothetical protein
MARAVQRVGDINQAGGVILSGDSSVLVNGKAAAVTGSSVGPHKPFKGPHRSSKAQGKGSGVLVGGKPLVATGDTDLCGHSRIGGSPDVQVG